MKTVREDEVFQDRYGTFQDYNDTRFSSESQGLVVGDIHVLTLDGRQPARESTLCRRMVVMAACMLIQFLCLGTGYGLSVMYVEIIDVFMASRSEAALIQSVFLGVTVAGGVFFGWLINRIGPGPCVIAGGLIACVGFVVSAFAVNVTMIIIFAGLVSGFGMSFAYLGSFITVSWTFHKDPGIPLVFLTAGNGIGQFVMPALFEFLITEYTWSGTFLIFGAILLNTVVCGSIIYTSREFFVTGNESVETSQKTCDSSLFKDLTFMNILFCSFLLSFTGPAEAWFLVDIMGIRGYGRETGSLFVSIIGLANFFGRLVGVLLRIFSKIPTVYHWIYLLPVLAVSHVLVTVLFDYWGIFCDMLLYGVAFGVTVAQTPAIIYEASGLERYPQAIAMLNVMYGVGNSLGGLTGGAIKDATGSYDLMFYLATAFSLFDTLATVAMLLILRMFGSEKFRITPAENSDGYLPLTGDKADEASYRKIPSRRNSMYNRSLSVEP